MRQDHVAGDKGIVDFSGKKLPIDDPKTGAKREAEIFVGALSASNLSHRRCKAIHISMLIMLQSGLRKVKNVNAIEFLGGTRVIGRRPHSGHLAMRTLEDPVLSGYISPRCLVPRRQAF